jgi:ubiquinone/menaquinone biosynthesis C-methylase UbiE
MSDNPILSKLEEYEAKNLSTKPLYDEWSNNYENDLLNNLGYSAHTIVAAALANLLPNRQAAIIDIGCGTGLVAQELNRHGFTNIDGIDISEDMLTHAKAKAIYGNLVIGDMNDRTSITDNSYDAAICAGSFAPGHLGPQSYREIIRFVRPNSPIAIFMNGVHFVDDNYEDHIQALEQAGFWELIEITAHNYMSALDRPGRLILTRKK